VRTPKRPFVRTAGPAAFSVYIIEMTRLINLMDKERQAFDDLRATRQRWAAIKCAWRFFRAAIAFDALVAGWTGSNEPSRRIIDRVWNRIPFARVVRR
jgi:hypothetical protein